MRHPDQMPIDPDSLPAELVPYAEALELRCASPREDRGWIAPGWPAPTVPLIPGAPPYDGRFRGSWISPGVCVRLDLEAVPEPLRSQLRARHPERIGADGAFYEYGIATSSQRSNRQEALLALALAVAALG
jgi:hypothetical protein